MVESCNDELEWAWRSPSARPWTVARLACYAFALPFKEPEDKIL